MGTGVNLVGAGLGGLHFGASHGEELSELGTKAVQYVGRNVGDALEPLSRLRWNRNPTTFGAFNWMGGSFSFGPKGPLIPRHFSDSADGIRLFKEAKAFRGELPGSAASKQYRNIVVADVVIDGQTRTVRFTNTPEISGKQFGMHSEERLIQWYDTLKNQKGRDVQVLRVFSDRIPCGSTRANCVGKLGEAFGSDLEVFYNILKGAIR